MKRFISLLFFVSNVIPVLAEVLPCECIHAADELPLVIEKGVAPQSLTGSDKYIDLIAFYNTQARQAAGGEAAVITKIQESVAYANEAYENSGLPIRVRLLAIESVNYAYPEGESLNRALEELNDPNDGELDELLERQRFYSADAVTVFLSNSRSGGKGNVLTPASSRKAYSIVRVENPENTLAHELGHNMGLRHREETYDRDRIRWFSDSYGEVFTGSDGKKYGTVMVDFGDLRDQSASRAPVFSSPSVRYLGAITGNGAADCVRAMRESMPYLVGFSPHRPPATAKLFAIDTGGGRITPVFTLENGYPDRRYKFQVSPDLKTWTTSDTIVATDGDGKTPQRGGTTSTFLPQRYFRWLLLD